MDRVLKSITVSMLDCQSIGRGSNPTFQSRKLNLDKCLSSLYAWFCFNGLDINPEKSEAILFGSHQRLRSLSSLPSIDFPGTTVPLSDTLGNPRQQASIPTANNKPL